MTTDDSALQNKKSVGIRSTRVIPRIGGAGCVQKNGATFRHYYFTGIKRELNTTLVCIIFLEQLKNIIGPGGFTEI